MVRVARMGSLQTRQMCALATDSLVRAMSVIAVNSCDLGPTLLGVPDVLWMEPFVRLC